MIRIKTVVGECNGECKVFTLFHANLWITIVHSRYGRVYSIASKTLLEAGDIHLKEAATLKALIQ